MTSSFDSIAEKYDRWFESPEGQAIFATELDCLRSLCPEFRGRWIEIGVGTGRFASALGIQEGIDPSSPMLAIAEKRGIRVTPGSAENLPFQESAFNGILLALALCFVNNAERTLSECHRILIPSGRLLLGIIPADGPWGREYIAKARGGHSVYSQARFRTVAETLESAKSHGFKLTASASALFWPPHQKPPPQPDVTAGIVADAGFLGLLFERKSDILQNAGENP
ncbi:MAG: class I SAM-dependent methyltransferase [Candidatus Zixiibacteriota bacterium]